MAHAVPFIQVSSSNALSVNDEAVELLSAIPGKIFLISAVGLYRSGKSSLLNMFLERKGLLDRSVAGGVGGFAIGDTVNRCTRGIWIWPEPIATEDGGSIVLMDTEGLGGVEADTAYDTRIFSLAVLLSSTLLFNSRGSIDEAAISNLSMITKLSSHISIGTTENVNTGFAKIFPKFMWVIRDFALDLTDDEGIEITAREYLEHALKPVDGFDADTLERNSIRHSINSFFSDVDCGTLVMPVVDEGALQNISTSSVASLRPDFQAQLDALVSTLMDTQNFAYKEVGGEPINGAILANLAVKYVHAIESGQVPTVSTAWQAVSQRESEAALKVCVETYKECMLETVKSKFPTRAELNAAHAVAARDAINSFDSRAVGPSAPELRATLSGQLEEEHLNVHAANKALSEALCKSVLERHIAAYSGKLSSKDIDFATFTTFWSDLESGYSAEAKGCARSEVLATIGLKTLLSHCVAVLRAEHLNAEVERKDAENRASSLQQKVDLLDVDLKAVSEKLKRADDAIAKALEEMAESEEMAKTLKETRVVKEEALQQKNKQLLLLKASLTTEKGKVDAIARNNMVLEAELEELYRVNDVEAMKKKLKDGEIEAEKLGERIAHLHEEINKHRDKGCVIS